MRSTSGLYESGDHTWPCNFGSRNTAVGPLGPGDGSRNMRLHIHTRWAMQGTPIGTQGMGRMPLGVGHGMAQHHMGNIIPWGRNGPLVLGLAAVGVLGLWACLLQRNVWGSWTCFAFQIPRNRGAPHPYPRARFGSGFSDCCVCPGNARNYVRDRRDVSSQMGVCFDGAGLPSRWGKGVGQVVYMGCGVVGAYHCGAYQMPD